MAELSTLRKFEALSPFEIKNELRSLAKEATKTTQSAFLDAGRGNPNWIATTPREGFFLLGQFAILESKRVMEVSPGIGGMPKATGVAARLDTWLSMQNGTPGAPFLSEMVKFAIKTFNFDPDAFVHELVDSIIGDNYPVPDRMLVHNERIVHEYLMWAVCGEPRPKGKFDLYAVEGGTAAMCYIFKSLKANRLLFPGDTIALGTPQENRFQFTDAEIKKLEDPKIKALFVVNPGNPSGMAMDKETIAKLAKLVKTKRPDLMLLTDDVYGTFVNDFRSLMDEKKVYQKACMEIVQRRFKGLIDSLGLQLSPNANYDGYYGLIDFEFWARKNIGDEAVEYLKKNIHPLDLAFRLAEDHGIVLLNGGGVQAPQWSLRVSLANLPDEAYEDIGRGVRAIARGYRQAFEAHQAASNAAGKAAGKKAPEKVR